jgi:hypothetical protein
VGSVFDFPPSRISPSYCIRVLVGAGSASNLLGFLKRVDLTPIMGRRECSIAPDQISREKLIFLTVFGIPTATALGDADKA